jgi:hypothetical protein
VFPPPPLPDLNLSSLTDEELLQLEGDERHNLEARVHCLRNINTLLNGAFVHIQQYMNMTMASSHLDNINRNRNVKVENDLKYLNRNKPTTSTAADNNNNQTENNFSSIDNIEKEEARLKRLNNLGQQQRQE